MLNKKGVGIMVLFSLVVLSGCGNKQGSQTQNTLTGTLQQEVFIVGKEAFLQDNVYGSVIADNINTILSSVAGKVEEINCQPGNLVSKGDLIAKILPIQEDVSFKNSLLMEKSLKGQLTRVFDTYKSTSENFDIQAQTLKQQKDTNIKQLNILNQNLENLLKQKKLTSGDINIQTQTLEGQFASLDVDKEKNVGKVKSNLDNLKKQNLNILTDAFKKIDEVFGITPLNKTRNDAYEIYLSANNPSLLPQIETKFLALYTQLPTLNDQPDSQVSQYLWDTANLLKLCADAVSSSIASYGTLPQSTTIPTQISIDGSYAMFNGLSNSILASKTNFDNVSLSYDSAVNNYDNQINTLTLNLQNLKLNKTDMTNITLDTQINNLISQINSLELAIKLAQDQLNSLQNNKNIQLNTLSSQTFSLQQNYDTVKNTINGENLYAGVDGVVKAKYITQGNKIAVNTLVCQISPNKVNTLKIQLFSSMEMELGSELEFYNKDTYLGTAKLEYELPFKDTVTQNYIYEITDFDFNVREGDRLRIDFQKKLDMDTLRIPLKFLTPKLEGYFVDKVLLSGGIQTVKVSLGEIDNTYVKVLSGLNIGDKIVY